MGIFDDVVRAFRHEFWNITWRYDDYRWKKTFQTVLKNTLNSIFKDFDWESRILPALENIGNQVNETVSQSMSEIVKVFTDISKSEGGVDLFDEIKREIDYSINILNGKYDYLNHPKKEWYSNDYSKPANYKGYDIHYYETIKIRNIISKHLKVKGYPLQTFKGISFDSGVSLWIPSFYTLAFTKTMHMWITNKADAWRYVYIVYEGSPRIKSLLAMVPFVDMDNAFRYFFYQVPVKIDIWKNMAFYNTAHDNLILANWDSCRSMLESF